MVTRDSMQGWILECLNKRGGSGWPKEVAKYVWEHHKDELSKSEKMLYTWQYDLRWAAQKLRDSGKLKAVHGKNNLPWELATQS